MKNNLLEIKNFGTRDQIIHVYTILKKNNCTYLDLKKVCTSFNQSVEGIVSLLIELSFIFEKNKHLQINQKKQFTIDKLFFQELFKYLVNKDIFYNLFTSENIFIEKNNIFIKNNLILLDYSYIRNLLLNLGFFIKDSFLVNTFQINSMYLDIFLDLYNLNQDKKIEYNFLESEKTILIKDNGIDSQKDIPPKVFISYSWDDEPHKKWVKKLADNLIDNGVDVVLDQYELQAGANISYFMEKSLVESEKVLIIFTENYQAKATNRKGGVGVEYSILNAEVCQNITNNKKYIPILRSGTTQTSIPPFMRQFISIYMQDDSKYDEQIKEIIHCVFEKPLIPKPKIGEKPDYLK